MLSPNQISYNILLAQSSNFNRVNTAVTYQKHGLDGKYKSTMECVAQVQDLLYVLTLANINDCINDQQQIFLWNILHGKIQDCPNNPIDLNYILWQDTGEPIIWQS